jgi:cytochrome c553
MPNTNRYIIAVLISALLAATPAYAGDTPEEIKRRIGGGNPVAGKDKSALCQGCHGEDGNSAVPSFPKLAGQYAEYIARQISNFQTGTRKDPTMTDMAATLTNRQDTIDIAAYFASQKQMSGTPVKNEAGEKIFIDYGCLNCHGEIGKGRPANNSIFPVIGGQHKDYVVKQLNDFKTGARDTDMSGAMNELTNKMTDAQIDAVADYLSGL